MICKVCQQAWSVRYDFVEEFFPRSVLIEQLSQIIIKVQERHLFFRMLLRILSDEFQQIFNIIIQRKIDMPYAFRYDPGMRMAVYKGRHDHFAAAVNDFISRFIRRFPNINDFFAFYYHFFCPWHFGLYCIDPGISIYSSHSLTPLLLFYLISFSNSFVLYSRPCFLAFRASSNALYLFLFTG